MDDDFDPTHLILELCWLANYDNIIDEWINNPKQDGKYASEEFYNTVFDDYLILEIQNLHKIDKNMAYYIYNVGLFLKKASPDYEEIDVSELIKNPNFIIAQKICQIIDEIYKNPS